jgi:hypothetical protein
VTIEAIQATAFQDHNSVVKEIIIINNENILFQSMTS